MSIRGTVKGTPIVPAVRQCAIHACPPMYLLKNYERIYDICRTFQTKTVNKQCHDDIVN